MYQKYEDIDVFNNSSLTYMKKSSSMVVSWISIILIGSILFSLIIFFYEYDAYNIYFAKVVNNEDNNYLNITVDESFISMKNRNYLEINNEVRKCHLKSMSDNYYIFNESKYWEVIYECDIPTELNINNNIVEVRVDKEKTTLFKELVNKVREGIKNGRIKN